MSNKDSQKGNPASTRMSNPKRATRRSLSWQRAQKRTAKVQREQAEREAANRQFIAAATYTEIAQVNEVHPDPTRKGTYGRRKRPSKVVRALRRAQARLEQEATV